MGYAVHITNIAGIDKTIRGDFGLGEDLQAWLFILLVFFSVDTWVCALLLLVLFVVCHSRLPLCSASLFSFCYCPALLILDQVYRVHRSGYTYSVYSGIGL